jgi:hypothetical protein
MRRTFALAPSTLALIVVALLASSAGIAVSFAGEVSARIAAARDAAPASVKRVGGRATEPDVPARTRFLRAPATQTGRIHAPRVNAGDGARSNVALGADRASLDLTAHRAPGASVEARQDGIASPGQPAPASRAPPIG